MPLLDVERPQLAQHLGAEMWRDLMFEKLPLALCCARGDVTGGLPLVDARAHEIGHRGLARFDVVAPAGGGDKLSAFDLRLALRAGEAVPFALALARDWIAHVEDDCIMTGRAFANVPLHFSSPSSFGLLTELLRAARAPCATFCCALISPLKDLSVPSSLSSLSTSDGLV